MYSILVLVGLIVVVMILWIAIKEFARSEVVKELSQKFPNTKIHAFTDGTFLVVDVPSQRIVVGVAAKALSTLQAYEAIYAFDKIEALLSISTRTQ